MLDAASPSSPYFCSLADGSTRRRWCKPFGYHWASLPDWAHKI